MAKTRSKTLKQTTLLDAFSSSPPHSPSPPQYKPEVTRRRLAASKGKRKRGSIISLNEKAGGDSSDSGVGAIHFEEKVIELTDDSEDSESVQRRSATKKRKTRVIDSDDEEVKLDSDDNAFQEEEADLPRRKTRSSKGEKRQIATSDEEEPEEVQPRRRKLVKDVKSPSPELEDDEVDTESTFCTSMFLRSHPRSIC